MLLTIDSGNTNIVFALYEGAEQRGVWRSSSDAKRTADEYAVWLSQLMSLRGLMASDVDAAIIATVVPQALFSLRTLCRSYFDCDPLVVGETGVDLGIGVLVDTPSEVGTDRLVNAVGAHERFGGPLIVIDFGTATTFDVVDEEGSYVGGVIAPGINLSLDALHAAAAQLPRVAVRRPPSVIGKRTVPAMLSGIYWGYVGLIEGLVARIVEEYGNDMKVIATGGLAPLFAEGTPIIREVDPEMTLRGLASIWHRNRIA